MKTTFNTGRLYTKRGQIINAEVHEGRVYFHDEDRGIAGSFACVEGFEPTTQTELRAETMREYDHTRYQGERMPGQGEARFDPAAFEARQRARLQAEYDRQGINAKA